MELIEVEAALVGWVGIEGVLAIEDSAASLAEERVILDDMSTHSVVREMIIGSRWVMRDFPIMMFAGTEGQGNQ